MNSYFNIILEVLDNQILNKLLTVTKSLFSMSGQECLAEGVEMWVCQCGCVSVNRKTSLKVVFLQSKLLQGQSYKE